MLVDPSPIGPRVEDYQHRRHRTQSPPALGGQPWRQADLDVQTAQQRLHVGDHGLDLDREQCPGCRVVCKKVNPPAITEVVEADLGSNLPAVRLQVAAAGFRDCCVIAVAKTGELGSTPAGIPAESQVQRVGNASNPAQGDAIGVTALEQTNGAGSHLGTLGKVGLPPTSSVAQSTNDRGKLGVVQAPMLNARL
jgi:hypothetical protein